jgi:hypothetical protein
VYIQVRRSKPLGVLSPFDAATAEPNCEMRASSTATPQSLMLLNGEFALQQAEAFAARVRKEAGAELKAQVIRAWKLAYLREPTEKELAGAMAFIGKMTAVFEKQPVPPVTPPKGKSDAKPPAPTPAERALAAFCQALLSSNRFLYVD